MLYMVVATHTAESCPMGNPEVAKKMRYGSEHLNEVAKKLNIKVNGSWVDAPAHVMYLLLDAPNAHDISRMMMEIRFMEWNTITSNPVLTTADVTKMVP
jgi:hypothetical protein